MDHESYNAICYFEQNNPSAPTDFELLIENYPFYNEVGFEELAEEIGGNVKLNMLNVPAFNLTCAIRVSHMLNTSGYKIPNITGKTISGKNGDQYIYRVTDLEAYLRATYGPPDFVGKEDIVNNLSCGGGIFIDKDFHATIWLGKDVGGGNYDAQYYLNRQSMVWQSNYNPDIPYSWD